jgi:hypothetical protein
MTTTTTTTTTMMMVMIQTTTKQYPQASVRHRRRATTTVKTQARTQAQAPCRFGERTEAKVLSMVMTMMMMTMMGSGASAIEETLSTTMVPTAYVPSPLSAEDGAAQTFVFVTMLVLGVVGMQTSLGSEREAREAALADKVEAQVKAMEGAVRTTLMGVRGVSSGGGSGGESDGESGRESTAVGADFEALRERGVVRLDGALGETACEALKRYVDETLVANDVGFASSASASPDAQLSMEVFGNVYCKKNRWDLKLSYPSVFTCFVALQDVAADMGPTLFIPGTNNARAHVEFQEANERGGPALERPHQLAIISQGDATLFDSRTLHCGTENNSSKRRVLFYFSFERAGSDNPNASVSTIRSELRGRFTLGDLL